MACLPPSVSGLLSAVFHDLLKEVSLGGVALPRVPGGQAPPPLPSRRAQRPLTSPAARRSCGLGGAPEASQDAPTLKRTHWMMVAVLRPACSSRSNSLENPRDGGAWWAAVYGVAQSRTRLM